MEFKNSFELPTICFCFSDDIFSLFSVVFLLFKAFSINVNLVGLSGSRNSFGYYEAIYWNLGDFLVFLKFTITTTKVPYLFPSPFSIWMQMKSIELENSYFTSWNLDTVLKHNPFLLFRRVYFLFSISPQSRDRYNHQFYSDYGNPANNRSSLLQ